MGVGTASPLSVAGGLTRRARFITFQSIDLWTSISFGFLQIYNFSAVLAKFEAYYIRRFLSFSQKCNFVHKVLNGKEQNLLKQKKNNLLVFLHRYQIYLLLLVQNLLLLIVFLY